MNVKRYILASIAVFIVMVIYAGLVHGVLLANLYQATANVWRGQADMMAFFPFNLVMKGLLTLWFVFILTRFSSAGGWQGGLTVGFYFGVFAGLHAAFSYYYLPIGVTLAGAWFLKSVVEWMLCGAVAGAIYRK